MTIIRGRWQELHIRLRYAILRAAYMPWISWVKSELELHNNRLYDKWIGDIGEVHSKEEKQHIITFLWASNAHLKPNQ